MAKAYSCDRCGELFKKEDFKDRIPVLLEDGNPFGVCLENSNAYLSLCPGCRAGFQKWWDNGAARKTTDHDHPPMVETLYEVDNEEEYDIATKIANMSTSSEKIIKEDKNDG